MTEVREEIIVSESDLYRLYPGLWEWLNQGPIHEYAVVRSLQLQVAALEARLEEAGGGAHDVEHHVEVPPPPWIVGKLIEAKIRDGLGDWFGAPGLGNNPEN